MTDEQIIRAIAELDGWTWKMANIPYKIDGWFDKNGNGPLPHSTFHWRFKYLTSYDAIIPVVQRQDESTRIEFVGFLQGPQNGKSLLEATPREICEALLRATGKWIE